MSPNARPCPQSSRPASRSLLSLFVAGVPALLLTAAGCSSESLNDFSAPPDGEGVQFKMITTLSPGQETERCQFFVAPPGGININHDEVRYTPGSHHVLLYLTPYPSVPTKDQRGRERDTSGVMDCPEGATADWAVNAVVAGAQKREGGAMVSYPADTAFKVPGGAVLLMNTHYLNASPEPLTAEARVNVYTLPDSEVKQEGGLLFFYNPFIRLEAKSRGSARMQCEISRDINLTNVQSHMHKRGVNYEAFLLDKDQKSSPLYQNTEWENVPVKRFEPALPVAAGSRLDYRCDYKNDEDHTITQGASTKDEMCMLIGSYYPRDVKLESCQNARWVGTGSKSCQVSMSCAIAAITGRDEAGFFGCVVDSCEAASQPLSEALRCFFSQGDGACEQRCKGPAMSDCNDCVSNACGPKFTACTATKC